MEIEQYYSSKVVSVVCGIGGGMGRYLLQTDAAYLIKLSQAGVTALVCGLLGAAGKYLFDLIVKQLKK
jgi:hypothetical protein